MKNSSTIERTCQRTESEMSSEINPTQHPNVKVLPSTY